ncbi:MAG TPA: COX15/CtaA family protein [Candidatus Eisenbacteria bacterium]
MTSTHAFRVASRLGLAATLLAYGLIVVGSIVRTTGSGLACPDWPLCEGRLIPRFESHVLIEWFHRLLALLVSVMVLATAGWVLAQGPARARLGGLAVLAIGLLALQVLLGALTVWKLLSPAIVSSHLAVALLLFATLLTLTLVARGAAETPADAAAPARAAPPRPAGMLALCGATAGLAYVQCLLGGLVSSNHAGLACPDWPLCNGQWFPALRGAVALQVVHRWSAYLLAFAVLVTAARARTAPDAGVRAGAAMAAVLTFAQIAIGAANVLLGLPPWASALHLANAEAILAMLVAITFRTALLPAPATPGAPAPVPA